MRARHDQPEPGHVDQRGGSCVASGHLKAHTGDPRHHEAEQERSQRLLADLDDMPANRSIEPDPPMGDSAQHQIGRRGKVHDAQDVQISLLLPEQDETTKVSQRRSVIENTPETERQGCQHEQP